MTCEMHSKRVFVLLVQLVSTVLIPVLQGHIIGDHSDSASHNVGPDGCSLASQKVTVSGYYKTKPTCASVDHKQLVSQYKNELKRACHSNQCCRVTQNVSSRCDGPVDVYIDFVLKVSCCCSAFTLRQTSCDIQIGKIFSRIQNRGILRLKMRRIRGKGQTVKLFQKDVRLVATEAFCPDAYKPADDGYTCRPCLPVTFTCLAHYDAPLDLCNNHGICECGQCECDPGWSGEFCDCSNSSCPTDDYNQTCSGHGHCDCGHCHCDPLWHGTVCECSYSDCPRSSDGHVCSGHGKCHCGRCICEEHTVGEACETCFEAITARNGSIHLSDLNVHHDQCTYSISSPNNTEHVLVAVKFPNNQTCSHLEMSVSDQNCTQGPAGDHRLNDSVAVQCSQAWFYSSKSNCLCVRVHNNGYTALDTNLIDARFMTYDRRFSEILDYAKERGFLDEFIQDDETWFQAVEFLCNPSFPVLQPEFQTLLSKLPQNLTNVMIHFGDPKTR